MVTESYTWIKCATYLATYLRQLACYQFHLLVTDFLRFFLKRAKSQESNNVLQCICLVVVETSSGLCHSFPDSGIQPESVHPRGSYRICIQYRSVRASSKFDVEFWYTVCVRVSCVFFGKKKALYISVHILSKVQMGLGLHFGRLPAMLAGWIVCACNKSKDPG